jgi:hypothetical protein
MTMEYVYFIISIAAGCLVLVLVWNISVSVGKGDRSLFARKPGNCLNADPIPPFKKTISGLSRNELDQITFQDRIDVWQKDHEVRRTRLIHSDVPLSGKKYIYTPPEKSRVAATGG